MLITKPAIEERTIVFLMSIVFADINAGLNIKYTSIASARIRHETLTNIYWES